MSYPARQHSPHASQSCLSISAVRSRTVSWVVIGMRGIGGPIRSRAFPIPFALHVSGDRKQLRPVIDAKYSSIPSPYTEFPCIGIDAVNNRIRNRRCNASTGNSETWKTASIPYAYVHKETCATNPPAHTGDSRDVTLRSEPQLSPFFFPDASFPAVSGGASAKLEKRTGAVGIASGRTLILPQLVRPPHLQEKRQRVNAASCHARRDKARRAVNEVRA